ncbi:glutathione S-transferase [Xylariomycetidae sp. FL0641]|nr:glutathione S-transferase [Xylariomycetidae sp. FL0641]
MASEEQAKVKLYWLEQSRAQNILWLLEELQIPYELETFHRAKMLAPPELQKVHPLGKSPVVEITPAGAAEPIVLAESGFIVQYLSEHFGLATTMLPKRWKDGQEGKVGGETEEYLRWQYILHFVEGTIMSRAMMAIVLLAIKGPDVPFFIRPVTALVSNQVMGVLIAPALKAQFAFLEKQLETSSGDYICGKDLTSADVLLSFVLISLKGRMSEFGKFGEGGPQAAYPKLYAYIDRLQELPGYKRSVQKIKDIDPSFKIEF